MQTSTAKEAQSKRPALDDGALHQLVLTSLDDDLAQDIISINLDGKSALADFMVVATGRSQRHVGALADHLLRKLKEAGRKDLKIEGQSTGDWVLVDAGDVVVHIFRAEVREFYGLEKMWATEAKAVAYTPSREPSTTPSRG
ncbi:MAG: ribosome silencing factor [Parvibaculales bacterium]